MQFILSNLHYAKQENRAPTYAGALSAFRRKLDSYFELKNRTTPILWKGLVRSMIKGISHITLIVKDLKKTTRFLQDIFDAKQVYSSGELTYSLSKEVFFLINDLWICIMEGESLSDRTYNHIAFQISEEDFEVYRAKVIATGAELMPDRPRIQGEGRSLYFYDYDNHLFELHTGFLDERLKNYRT